MRKLTVQKRSKRKQERTRGSVEYRLRPNADKRLLPRWEDAGNGLEYLQVGKFFGVWRRRTARKRRDSSLVRLS